MAADDLLYVGFNRRVAALDKQTGAILWQWKAPAGSGFVSLLLDGDHLFASVNGYQYGLDARTGAELWRNAMKGFGWGVTSLCSRNGRSPDSLLGEAQAKAARARAAGAPGQGAR